MIQVPAQGRPRERRAMAENALMIVLNERAALLRTVPYEKGQTGQEEWAVSGVKKISLSELARLLWQPEQADSLVVGGGLHVGF